MKQYGPKVYRATVTLRTESGTILRTLHVSARDRGEARARATEAIRYSVRRSFFTYDRKLQRDSFNALTRSCSAWTAARRRGRYSQ